MSSVVDKPGPAASPSGGKALAAAGVSLARGAWQDAIAHYGTALEHDPHSAQALEGLSMAAWWCNDTATSFAARQGAYRHYRRGGDMSGAARMALRLGVDCVSWRDAPHAARCWFKRAERLLDQLEPGADHAWLALWQAQVAMVGGDIDAGADQSTRAGELGRSLGVVSLDKLAAAQVSLALMMGGSVAAASVELSDHDVVAIAQDLDNIDLVASACSGLMYAWEQVKAFDSMDKWWGVLDSVPAPWSSSWLLWLCRIQHSAALMWRGEWVRAEQHLSDSIHALQGSSDDIGAEAVVRLATLRRRQGQNVATAELLEQASCAPLRLRGEQQALLAWGELSLDRGDATSARCFAQQALDASAPSHCVARLDALALLVNVEVLCGKADLAHGALSELQRSSCSVASDGVRATVRLAEGMVAVSIGEFASAVSRLEEAVALFERAGGCFEAAQARFELAVALAGAGNQQPAMREAASAMGSLASLGAGREAERAQQRLPSATAASPGAGSRANTPTRRDSSGLTSREVEILRLVARGHTNLAIAEELSLSVRTVERHLSNIYEKVQASGKTARAAAVAFVLRHGLLADGS